MHYTIIKINAVLVWELLIVEIAVIFNELTNALNAMICDFFICILSHNTNKIDHK